MAAQRTLTPGQKTARTQPKAQNPAAINGHIDHACIVAVIAGALTVIAALIAIGGTQLVPGVGGLALVDAAILFGLAFGIYKRSRTCAILLTIYALANQVYTLDAHMKPSIWSYLFLYFYIRAIPATFAYHNLRQADAAPESLPTTMDLSAVPFSRARSIQPSLRAVGRALDEKTSRHTSSGDLPQRGDCSDRVSLRQPSATPPASISSPKEQRHPGRNYGS